MTRWVALMPLRGGSKSIPGKNLLPVAGRPLFAWSLGEAIVSGCFDAVYVATDSEAIRKAVLGRFGNSVTVVERGPETATDDASSESVMLEFQRQVSFDVLALVQATSPLTTAEDFRRARRRFETEQLDSLLTAVEFRRFLWRTDATPVNYDPMHRPRRQEFRPQLLENGAFYYTRRETLALTRNRLGGRIGIHIMAPDSDLELDEPADREIMAGRLARRRGSGATGIRALALDVDGTLTDAGMYYDTTGAESKRFCTRDGKGLELLRAAGIQVCVITAEDSPAVAARMRKLGISHYFPGVRDKLPVLVHWATRQGLTLGQIAYMGDDVGDLPCMAAAGISLCPADAVPEVTAQSDYICTRSGGFGAVREACNWLLLQSPAGSPVIDRIS